MYINNKYLGKYRIKSTCLPNYNYGANGYYLVTICTKDGLQYFGEIVNHKMVYNRIGYLAIKFWRKIPLDFKWQSRFYDELIKNDEHLYNVRQYIKNNQSNWCKK